VDNGAWQTACPAYADGVSGWHRETRGHAPRPKALRSVNCLGPFYLRDRAVPLCRYSLMSLSFSRVTRRLAFSRRVKKPASARAVRVFLGDSLGGARHADPQQRRSAASRVNETSDRVIADWPPEIELKPSRVLRFQSLLFCTLSYAGGITSTSDKARFCTEYSVHIGKRRASASVYSAGACVSASSPAGLI
jgi:hypothetical protein